MKKSVLTVAVCLIAPQAFGYIDPGTGSALIQGVIAGIAAIGVTLKLYWHRVVSIFAGKKDAVDKTETQGSGDEIEVAPRSSD